MSKISATSLLFTNLEEEGSATLDLGSGYSDDEDESNELGSGYGG